MKTVSYTHLRAHETKANLVCRLLLEKNAQEAGYWTLQAQLFTSNIVSKAFFEKQGFRQVGIREKIGQLDSKWVDNYLYEKNFN